MFDDINFGNAYFEIITDSKKSYLQFYHIDSTSCRLAVDNINVIIHPIWNDYKGVNDPLRRTLPIFPKFEKKEDEQYHSIYHIVQYEPEFYNYGLPTWYAGLNSLIIAGLTDRWNQSRLENQFNSPGMLFVPGVNSDAEEKAMDAMFNSYAGIDNEKSHTMLVQYLADLSPGQSREKAQYVEFKKMMRATGLIYTFSHITTCSPFITGLRLFVASLVRKLASTPNVSSMNMK